MNNYNTRLISSVRLGVAVAAVGICTVMSTTVAQADPDGTPRPPDVGAARNDIGSGPDPAAAVDVRRLLNDIDTPLAPLPVGAAPAVAPVSTPEVVQVNDTAWDAAQLAVGAIAGAALTAGGMVLIQRRREPHPA